VFAVAEDILALGAVPIPVFDSGCSLRCGHIAVGQDERVAVDGVGVGEVGDGQGALVGVQRAAPPRAGIGGDLLGVQCHPADQQSVVRGPPSGTVVGDGDLRTVHAGRLSPSLARRSRRACATVGRCVGADREVDPGEVRGGGQVRGEVPGVGAQRHLLDAAGQGGQRAAQQPARPGTGIIGTRVQLRGQGGPGLGLLRRGEKRILRLPRLAFCGGSWRKERIRRQPSSTERRYETGMLAHSNQCGLGKPCAVT